MHIIGAMSSSGDSDFPKEMASGVAVASSVLVDDGEQFYDSIPGPPAKRPWYKRLYVLYTVTAFLVLAIVAFVVVAAVVAVVGGVAPYNVGSTPKGDTGAPSAPPSPPPSLTPTSALTAAPSAPLTLSPTAPPTAFERTSPLAFYVMGDVPYSTNEEQVLKTQIAAMNSDLHPGASFIVHVGDMMKADQSGCSVGAYTSVRNMLSLAPVPAFVMAGDNDLLDCPSPETAWGYYQDTFIDFEQEWALQARQEGGPFLDVSKVERNANSTEMFAFIEDGILFLSVNLMNMPSGEDTDAAFDARLATSKAWVTKQLAEKFHQNAVRGVVMFGHAQLSGDVRIFFEDIQVVFTEAQVLVPVLYMHGDGHRFFISDDFAQNYNWPYFTDIQVAQGAEADPLLVTVAMVKDGIMEPLVAENSTQTIIGSGLFRIDQQGGCYDGDNC